MGEGWLPIVSHIDESEGEMIETEFRKRGRRRADRGIHRAEFSHEPQIRRGVLLFLDCLLTSPNGCATLDAATEDITRKHADGGKWRASIPKRLKTLGLIVSERVVKSARPARHAGYLTEWRLVNRPAAVAMRAALASQLQKETGESAGTDSPAVNTSTFTTNGANEHGKAV